MVQYYYLYANGKSGPVLKATGSEMGSFSMLKVMGVER